MRKVGQALRIGLNYDYRQLVTSGAGSVQPTPYIVGNDPGDPYATIQAALTAAIADGRSQDDPALILLKVGTFPSGGDIALRPGIHIGSVTSGKFGQMSASSIVLDGEDSITFDCDLGPASASGVYESSVTGCWVTRLAATGGALLDLSGGAGGRGSQFGVMNCTCDAGSQGLIIDGRVNAGAFHQIVMAQGGMNFTPGVAGVEVISLPNATMLVAILIQLIDNSGLGQSWMSLGPGALAWIADSISWAAQFRLTGNNGAPGAPRTELLLRRASAWTARAGESLIVGFAGDEEVSTETCALSSAGPFIANGAPLPAMGLQWREAGCYFPPGNHGRHDSATVARTQSPQTAAIDTATAGRWGTSTPYTDWNALSRLVSYVGEFAGGTVDSPASSVGRVLTNNGARRQGVVIDGTPARAVTSTDHAIYMTGTGVRTVTLPHGATEVGRVLEVFDGAGTAGVGTEVFVAPVGADTINGAVASTSISAAWSGHRLRCVYYDAGANRNDWIESDMSP